MPFTNSKNMLTVPSSPFDAEGTPVAARQRHPVFLDRS
jgi:hypothetical protein